MGLIVDLFNILLYQPFFNGLILLYEYLPGHDFGVTVIVFTILTKLILYPLGVKGIKSQKALQTLQPKIKAVQEKFKNDKARQTKEVMEVYKKEKINPFSGFLLLLIQLPILLALFRVFWNGFGEEQLQFLYGFVPHPGQMETTFLGIVNLAEASIVLAMMTGVVQFVQAKMISPSAKKASSDKSDFSSMMQKQMLYFFPVFTVFILWRLPSALALYWLVSTLFTIGQQYIILRKNYDPNQPKQN